MNTKIDRQVSTREQRLQRTFVRSNRVMTIAFYGCVGLIAVVVGLIYFDPLNMLTK